MLVPPAATEAPVVVLPTNPPYETEFSKTTTYHWPNFDVNATENNELDKFDKTQQGPFGFGKAVGLDGTQNQVFSRESGSRIINVHSFTPPT